MTKYEEKMKNYEGNMKKYGGICRKYEEMWRKYEEIWRNVGLRRIPGLPAGGGQEFYADADTIPRMALNLKIKHNVVALRLIIFMIK